MPELFIGLMSGTSMDAVDAAMVELSLPEHDARSCRILHTHSQPMPTALRDEIAAIVSPDAGQAIKRLGALDHRLGHLFADTALMLLKQSGIPAAEVKAIGSHGQTLWHQPDGARPFTMQIADPNIIATRTGITTIADFRRRDMALGGQGAPLVPAFHAWLFRSSDTNRAVVNIGGIANITVLPRTPGSAVTGFDSGPGNVLMDIWASRQLGTRMDVNGDFAAGGRLVPHLLEILLEDPYFSRSPPKSTGREQFNLDWLSARLSMNSPMPAARDIQATLAALTARTIADAIRTHAPDTEQVLLCGGGVYNRFVVSELSALLENMEVAPVTGYGIKPDWVEAAAFAWLAQQTLAGRAGNLPDVTGASAAAVLGGIYRS